MRYEIVLAGTDERLLSVALEGLVHRFGPDPSTVVVRARDHAEIVGVVNRLHGLGLEIVSLRRVDAPV